ncbi:MAG: putative Ig domain-containing protein [Calditrichaeota bacterium]|nr:putative Ig domain-containing protein [Calditrichota bacterium]
MNTITIRQVITIITIFPTLLLTGCLAGDESEAGFVGNRPPSQNSAPTISGNPQSAVMMGDSYSFTPTASDPDGDALTFSIVNLPVWATFDSSTGRVAGSPTLADIGLFTSIEIAVSDGTLKASLPPFSVEVSQVALGSATLSWTPPTQNEDGSPLTNLAGYKFYFGTSMGIYTNQVRVDNPGITSYVIDNLVPNTYFFVATAVNSAGVESSFTNETSKQVM